MVVAGAEDDAGVVGLVWYGYGVVCVVCWVCPHVRCEFLEGIV